MSDNDNQLPNSEKPVVSGRLRVEPWDATSSCQPQLKLFCGPDAFQFVSPSSHPEPPRAQTRNNRSGNSSYMNDFVRDLLSFCEFGRRTQVLETIAATFGGEPLRVPTYVNEFWTAKQRAAHSLHEISYRACFKPQLPRFFSRLTQALAAGNAPRSHCAGAFGLLSGRVHISFQPAEIGLTRQTLLPLGATSRAGVAGSVSNARGRGEQSDT